MKTKLFASIALSSLLAVTACHTGSSSTAGRDTARNKYPATNGIDTAKVSTAGADASLDNSGSGGTKIGKDTTKKPDKK